MFVRVISTSDLNINQWATGASAEKTYQNKTSGDYSAGNMRGAPTSVLGSLPISILILSTGYSSMFVRVISTSDFLPVTSPVTVPPWISVPLSICLPHTVVNSPLSATWDGVDSVQLTGKTLVSAEQPARTDTKISYNNLEDKPTIPTLPAQVSSAEKTARTGRYECFTS
jgi:hypothetical protein